MAFGGFVFSFAHESLGFAPSPARALNACFWGAITVGRLVAIPVATRFSPAAMLGADLVGCVVAAAALCLAPRCDDGGASIGGGADGGDGGVGVGGGVGGVGGVGVGGGVGDGGDGCPAAAQQPLVWAATVAFGLSMASIFPCVITYAERVISVTGAVTSLFVVGAALGELLVPLLVASLYRQSAASFLDIVVAVAVAQAAAFVGAWRLGGAITRAAASGRPEATSSTELQRAPV